MTFSTCGAETSCFLLKTGPLSGTICRSEVKMVQWKTVLLMGAESAARPCESIGSRVTFTYRPELLEAPVDIKSRADPVRTQWSGHSWCALLCCLCWHRTRALSMKVLSGLIQLNAQGEMSKRSTLLQPSLFLWRTVLNSVTSFKIQ